MHRKVVLIIMDGWGIAPPDKFNAIHNAHTPHYDKLIREYPNTLLKSDGLSVGLPEGQFGTSEVNHLTIGSGRVIMQDLPRINEAIAKDELVNNQALRTIIDHVKANKTRLHLLGILSDGGVHSHINHVIAMLKMLDKEKFPQPIYFHVFTDGRDVPPQSAEQYFKQLDEAIAQCKSLQIKIATIQGRVFLDRDRDWSKTEKAFQLMAHGKGSPMHTWEAALNFEYNQRNKDEFIKQHIVDKQGTFKKGDGAILFHYRTDRIYQLIHRILSEHIADFKIASFVSPSEELTELLVAFPRIKATHTLASAIAEAGKSQTHVAETEKFPHVTYFFNGEREKELPNERWHGFDSNRYVESKYNFEPSMRNYEVTKYVIEAVESNNYDFILANLSSPDMVGHSGNYEAAVVSAESVDFCLGKLYTALESRLHEYAFIVTADHGNSDMMWDYENNQPHTQHTLSKVPFILVSDIPCRLDRRESLEDIAPTVLDLMGITKPQVMTGTSLILRHKPKTTPKKK